MLPPQRFYYNMGEFLRDMQQPTPPPSDDDSYFEMGAAIARAYKGAMSELDDSFMAMKLAGELMARITGMDFNDVEDDDDSQ